MSRATVRAAIQSFLAPPNVAGLQTVVAYPPKVLSEQQFFVNEAFGTGTGAVAFIYLDDDVERRIALGGVHGGRKWVEYRVHLLVFLRSAKPRTEDVGLDNDNLIDNLKARMRSDRTFGAPGVIFQAGEGGEQAGDDIRTRTGLPVDIQGGMTQVFSTITVDVVEILNT